MSTKATSSLMTQGRKKEKHFCIMKSQIRTTLKWRAEWVHIFEEVLNDNNNNNNTLKGQRRPGIIFRKKASVVL